VRGSAVRTATLVLPVRELDLARDSPSMTDAEGNGPPTLVISQTETGRHGQLVNDQQILTLTDGWSTGWSTPPNRRWVHLVHGLVHGWLAACENAREPSGGNRYDQQHEDATGRGGAARAER
jgi:hypothetical protein